MTKTGITPQQRIRILVLAEDVQQAAVRSSEASDRLKSAEAAFKDYLSSLEVSQ